MKISIQELFDLIDVCDTAGRQSAIDTVAECTVPGDMILINPSDNWVIPSDRMGDVAERLGVSLDDLVGACAQVDNT